MGTVLGIRCTKDEIYIAVLEGSKEEPIITDSARAKIKLTAPKTAESRGEELNYLKREFSQILHKYKPSYISIKDQETSPHKIPIHSIAQRAELEGVLIVDSYELQIPVKKLQYSQIKGLLGFEEKSKSFQYGQVEKVFNIQEKDDNIKDSILCAWAVLV
jgi:Holliday junction resolvasome RuvABC endonuclease subunit